MATQQRLLFHLLFAALALFTLTACEEENDNEACTEDWHCGSLESCVDGECQWRACHPESNPICDVSGDWYSSECEARLDGAEIELEPVCGENGLDYGNACGALGDDTEVAHEGECEPEEQHLLSR